MAEVTALPPISYQEAEAIAMKIDPQAGGFFRGALIRAAMEGAKLAQANLTRLGLMEKEDG